ncbi:MAG: hypothetical protein ACI30N_07195 [Muribaculaceae bacterium]
MTDKRFWMGWIVLILLMALTCFAEGWREDTAVLGAAYALSLLSTGLCHKINPKTALGNLIVMLAYNALLSYNLAFNSHHGTGLTWLVYILLLNASHSVILLIFALINTVRRKKPCNMR